MRILFHGKTGPLTGFSLINRRLIRGLRARGHSVAICSTDVPDRQPASQLADAYIFHGDPFDFDHPVGAVNAFFLSWEYRRLPERWVSELNRRFDVVIVPSRATAEACHRSGVRRLIRLCPAAVDAREFHPGRRPAPVPSEKGFRFIHFGGAHDRRGTDVLLRAYAAEFSAADDVCLILKAFHYEHHRPWLERALHRAGIDRPGAPELYYVHETLPSVAPYVAAADVGVFPLRAECTGLPVLECIASGRPVIATRGTGLDEFCCADNTDFIRATPTERQGKAQLEPDLGHLKRQMRNAYRRGPLDRVERDEVASTVSRFTWDRSVDLLVEALRDAKLRRPVPGSRSDRSIWVAWRAPELGAATQFSGRYATRGRPALTIGRVGESLEAFREAKRRNPSAPCVLRVVAAPRFLLLESESRRRRRVGLESLTSDPIHAMCTNGELGLADTILASSRALRDCLRGLGVSVDRTEIVSPAFPRRRWAEPLEGAPSFLFASRTPLRSGLEPLLKAWAQLRPDARLTIVGPTDVLGSRRFLELLIRHPSISFFGDLSPRHLASYIRRATFVVAPDLEVGDSWVAEEAMARGRAVIASKQNPVADWIDDGRDGWVLRRPFPSALAEAIDRAASSARDRREIGLAARAKARALDAMPLMARLRSLRSTVEAG